MFSLLLSYLSSESSAAWISLSEVHLSWEISSPRPASPLLSSPLLFLFFVCFYCGVEGFRVLPQVAGATHADVQRKGGERGVLLLQRRHFSQTQQHVIKETISFISSTAPSSSSSSSSFLRGGGCRSLRFKKEAKRGSRATFPPIPIQSIIPAHSLWAFVNTVDTLNIPLITDQCACHVVKHQQQMVGGQQASSSSVIQPARLPRDWKATSRRTGAF